MGKWRTDDRPSLLYGPSLTIADVKSLDFIVIRFLMKLFKSANMDIINNCLLHFKFSLPSELSPRRKGEIYEQICLLSQFALTIWNWLRLLRIVLCICCINVLPFIWRIKIFQIKGLEKDRTRHKPAFWSVIIQSCILFRPYYRGDNRIPRHVNTCNQSVHQSVHQPSTNAC